LTSDNLSGKTQSIKHFFYLALGFTVSLYVVFVLYWAAHAPNIGAYVYQGDNKKGLSKIIAIDSDSPAERAGFLCGDEIIRIGDEGYFGPIEWYKIVNTYKIGRPTMITYQRGPGTFTTQLIPASPVFPLYTFLGLIISSLLLTTGFIMYLKKPLDPAAKIFYLQSCTGSVGIIHLFSILSAMNPFSFVAIIVLFTFPLLLHFVLIFPYRKPIIVNHPIILKLVYLPMIITYCIGAFFYIKEILAFIETGHTSGSFEHFLPFAKFVYAQSMIYAATAIIIGYHTNFTEKNPEIKRQFKWLKWGGVVSTVFLFYGTIGFVPDLELFIVGAKTPPIAFAVALIVIIFSMFFSLLKYRLMDIDIVIHYSFSYILMSGTLMILYFLIFGAFNWIAGFILGKNTFVIYAFSAVIVAFIFRPMLSKIEHWVEKIFFRQKYEFHMAVESLMEALISVRNPEGIFKKMYRTVEETLHVKSGILFFLENEQDKFIKIHSEPLKNQSSVDFIHVTHPLIIYLTKFRKGLTCYQVKSEIKFEKDRDAFLQEFNDLKMEIFIPLIYENALIGIIGFGEKRSSDLYSSSDVGMLTTLAHQAAIAMENAKAYNEIEKLNDSMKENVKYIKQQHEEISTLQKQVLNENIYLKDEIKQNFNFDEIIGSSQSMKDVLNNVKKIAPSPSTVLIRGESGTGKELIARAIHYNSLRKDKPFIKVNCAAIPSNLLESELFGHVKGAFTGAVNSKPGKFELANEGTIFLDEIGELPPELQVKILRALQEREIEKIGCVNAIKVDVRVIAATNRDLEKAMSEGTFREDLYWAAHAPNIGAYVYQSSKCHND